ncbi:LapA family protein [Allokutzneria multivorans]|uniref:LapA family protein n=1 Tax=Allokutzneria multivorans TaxID=1142134 RepID=UPI003CD07D9D
MSTPSDDRVSDQIPTDHIPTEPVPVPGPVAPPVPGPGTSASSPSGRARPTRISGTWVAVVVAIVVLIFLLVFILQNLTDVTIHFLGASFTWPLGVSLLFAAIGGAALVALVGAARILQLRRQAKRAPH